MNGRGPEFERMIELGTSKPAPMDKVITPQMVRTFAKAARQPIRNEGGYRRDHLRVLAQRVEVADFEVRIRGSKTRRLQALTEKTAQIQCPVRD